MTDFRAKGTIMGPAGLTTVFGMGTGVAPPVWSPGSRPGRASAPRPGVRLGRPRRGFEQRWSLVIKIEASPHRGRFWPHADSARVPALAAGGGGSGWSSRSAVGTGPLRPSRVVHSRPIDLLVSQEPSQQIADGSLVSKRASRLDAFSAYPFPTWLPGGAPSGTAGTPEVGPPQSSRTRGDPSQASHAHGR